MLQILHSYNTPTVVDNRKKKHLVNEGKKIEQKKKRKSQKYFREQYHHRLNSKFDFYQLQSTQFTRI